jgi:hypothetical protein
MTLETAERDAVLAGLRTTDSAAADATCIDDTSMDRPE